MSEECPFCERIAAGEVVGEEGTAVAFPDVVPVTRGHTLVVPRRHEPDLLGLSTQELDDMWHPARRLCTEPAAEVGADRSIWV